nr:patatin-like phospholipase family protein [uncultured Holophaga sp.]
MLRVLACLLALGSVLGAGEVLRLQPSPPDHRLRFASDWMAPGQRRIALSLRGGSAKGLAHIGVLERFDEEGIPFHALTGTSAGALVASLSATGVPPEVMADIFRSFDMGTLLDDRRRNGGRTLAEDEADNQGMLRLGFSGGRVDTLWGQDRSLRIQAALTDIFAQASLVMDGNYDHLRVPLRIVATDLQTGEAHVFRSGSLPTAVQASMTIPGMLAPVEVHGHQLVDGGLVENLPVGISRTEFPDMLQVGVDIARSWEASRVTSLPQLLGRSLEASMHQNELRSRQEADLLISPAIDFSEDFDFHHQVTELVVSGREAFDRMLPALEDRIYGGEGLRVVATGLDSQGTPFPQEVAQLVRRSLPASGPLRAKDLYRLLRRIHRSLPVQEAWIELPEGGKGLARLHLRPAPLVRTVRWQLPTGLSAGNEAKLRQLFERPGLRTGDPFSERVLDAALTEGSLQSALPGMPLILLQDTHFEAQNGTLVIAGRALTLHRLRFEVPGLGDSVASRLKDLEGEPLAPGTLIERILAVKSQFDLGPITVQSSQGTQGLELCLASTRRESVALNLSPGYESDSGARIDARLKIRQPWGTPVVLGATGYASSLDRVATLGLDYRIPWRWNTGFSLEAGSSRRELARDPYAPGLGGAAPSQAILSEDWLRAELWQRIGYEARGKVSLGMDWRKGELQSGSLEVPEAHERVLRVAGEWDNFDFHTLPTQGALVRLRAGRSLQSSQEGPDYRFAYGRIRTLGRLGPLPASLDIDLESALGWNTPLSRRYLVGGSAFLMGSSPNSLLLSNLAVARIGLPFTRANLMGVGVQATPRFDFGRFADTPTTLRGGSTLQGTGLLLEFSLRGYRLQLSYGVARLRDGDGTHRDHNLTLQIGSHSIHFADLM